MTKHIKKDGGEVFKIDTNLKKIGGTLYMKIPSEIVNLLEVTELDKAIISVKKKDELSRVEFIKPDSLYGIG